MLNIKLNIEPAITLVTYGFHAIVRAVLAAPMPCGITLLRHELYSHFRSRAHVEARMLVIVLARRYMRDPSYPRIGHMLDRDHTSIMHLAQRFAKNEEAYRQAFADAEQRLLASGQQRLHVTNEPRHLPQRVPFQ